MTPSALRPFDQVKDKVKADWSARKIRRTRLEKARKLAERGNAGTPLDTLGDRGRSRRSRRFSGLKRNETTKEFDAAADLGCLLRAGERLCLRPRAGWQGRQGHPVPGGLGSTLSTPTSAEAKDHGRDLGPGRDDRS